VCTVSAWAAEFPGRQLPIKELRERTSSLVGRDVVIAGTAERIVPITTDNFDEWKMVGPCVGSYIATVKDDTGSIDVLVHGNCVSKLKARHEARIEQGQTIWIKVRMFVPDLNMFALNPTVRAVAQDFGPLASE
jgi:hypothetical protein